MYHACTNMPDRGTMYHARTRFCVCVRDAPSLGRARGCAPTGGFNLDGQFCLGDPIYAEGAFFVTEVAVGG